jgi:hypothetical protein
VGQRVGDMQQSPKTLLSPSVFTNKPTIGKAVVDKPLRMASSSGPTTRSKYAQALAYIVSRGRSMQHQPPLNMTELAQAIIDDNPTVEFTNEVFDMEYEKLLKYQKLITHPKYHKVWMHSSANKFRQLPQGVGGRIKGTNMIFFVHKHQVPQDRWKDVTYAKFVCELKPNKAEVHRTRLAVGGDKVHYPGKVGTPTADLTLVKMNINSVIFTHGA